MSDIITESLSAIVSLLSQDIFSYLCFGVMCFSLIYTAVRFLRGS